MDLFDGLAAAFRRWYVLVPILIVTAAIAFVVHQDRTVEYSAQSQVGVTTNSVVVQPAVKAGKPTVVSGNALINNGGTTLIANLLATGLERDDVLTAVSRAGGSTDYQVVVQSYGSAGLQLPILMITVTGPTAKSVARTAAALDTEYQLTLRQIQRSAGVPTNNYARAFSVQPFESPVGTRESSGRNTGIVIAVGIVVALVISGAIDNIASRRRQRRRPAPSHSASSLEGPSDDA